MSTEVALWSLEKQKNLQEQLVGSWAEDIWVFPRKRTSDRQSLRLTLISPSLKTEFKYALWWKFESGAWSLEASQSRLFFELHWIIAWLNQVAPSGTSFLEKPLEYWELSLRSTLLEAGQYKTREMPRLNGSQQIVTYQVEDGRILLLRQIYAIVCDGYDDRPETEKDIWNMRKMGLVTNLTGGERYLNFTSIVQPWLRRIAKIFLEYNTAIRSVGDCQVKLLALRTFSLFLAKSFPAAQAPNIDRSVIVQYVSYLRDCNISVTWRRQQLISLRTILETCAHRLGVVEITRERIIFSDDFPQDPKYLPREIPEEVLVQLREHLDALPTIALRMVVILLEVGLRIGELCSLPIDCLVRDDKNDWYLRFYQSKLKQEHIIPLVNESVIGAIQAQQQDVREKWENECHYLFPGGRSHRLPYQQESFSHALNLWALNHTIRDQTGKLYRFQAHQFRHTVGMRLINDDVPLDVIRRLFGHRSLTMTERYARKRAAKVREELERAYRKRKTVDYQGNAVKGDPQANDPEVQMVRKGVRGQTLPVGGCGRLVVLGECNYANKCLTCPMWLTSTEELPALKSFYERAVRLKQRAGEAGNQCVVQQQDRIITNLAVRIKSLENTEVDGTLCVNDVLTQLRTDLAEAENALEEAQENGLILAAKYLERTINDLKARITALEETT